MRKSNQLLIAEFRQLLTEGAKTCMDQTTLDATKPYRSQLWKAFAEIELRLDPLKELELEKKGGL